MLPCKRRYPAIAGVAFPTKPIQASETRAGCRQPRRSRPLQNGSDDTDAKSIKGNRPHDRHIVERRHIVPDKTDGSKARIDDRGYPLGLDTRHIRAAIGEFKEEALTMVKTRSQSVHVLIAGFHLAP